MKVVSTKPVYDNRGRVVRDMARERRLAEIGDQIRRNHRCRVCRGAPRAEWDRCAWCVDGAPKYGCGDCIEPLPMCACMRPYFARAS